MKKVILILAIASAAAIQTIKAQTVNDVKLSDLKEEYIEVTEYRRLIGDETFIALDYGQKKDENRFREVVVRDEKGKYKEYNSVIDFVNKMKPNGYELFQVYTINSAERTFPKYILKRRKD